MSNSFNEWAVYAHKDDTGFGRMAADARSILGIGRHFVIHSERLQDHPIDEKIESLLPKDASEVAVRALLQQVEGILFFERAGWHPQILKWAREMGVRTVCVPMWEWFNGNAPEWKYCDLFACPTHCTEKVVRSYGHKNTVFLPWVVDLAKLPERHVSGPAKLFVHNAGLVDRDDRKGTRETIKAFCRVKRDDIRLVVRMQKEAALPPFDERVTVEIGNLPDMKDLYRKGDAFIQPSKMEGIGFMVLEPVCCGLPVITCDYPPMNEFVRQSEMRGGVKWFKRRAYATNWIKHAHLRLPRINALRDRIEWAAEHDLTAISQENRAWACETFDPQVLSRRWEETVVRALGL